jgi:hypothetical protein
MTQKWTANCVLLELSTQSNIQIQKTGQWFHAKAEISCPLLI